MSRMTSRKQPIRPYLVLLLLLLAAGAARPVLAHANLAQSTPPANAVLARSPVQLELIFTEPVEASFSRVEVLNSQGVRVDNDDARVDAADPTRLTATVRSLPDGVYTVSWRVLSTLDGHTTAGIYPFAVGNVAAADLAAAQASTSVSFSPLEALARWLTYATMLMLVGGVLFVVQVWQPVAPAGALPDKVLWRRMAKIALAGLLLASVIWLLVQAGQATGRVLAFPWEPELWRVLLTTRFGALWLARIGLTLLLLRLLLTGPGRRALWLAFGVGLLLLLTVSLGSHAAAEPEPALPLLADWLHLLVAAVWVGGLAHFVAGMILGRQLDPAGRTRLAAQLIPRFSALALVSVAVLVLTGVYASLLHVGSWAALTTTLYGQTLLIKVMIFLPLVVLGAVNLLSTGPQMKRATSATGGDSWLVTRFRQLITSEVTLAAAVVLSVGVLTTLPPAASPELAPLGGKAQVDDLAVTLAITPGRVGINSFLVTVTADGQPLNDARAVELRFTPAQADLPPSEAQLTAQGDGQYSIDGAFLSLPDAWQVQVVVRRSAAFDSFANFDVDLTPAGVTTQRFPWARVIAGLLLLVALSFLWALWPLVASPARRVGLVGVPAGGLVLVGLFLLFQAPTIAADNFPLNPVPPNAESLAAGAALYAENCVPCHGVTGAGDGPVGRTLNPPPADLTQHTVPGIHSDGRLYDWITNGFADSVMPAFGDQLSDEQRWHLVNYIRTLATGGEASARGDE